MYCKKCGEEITEGSLQCEKCGCRITVKSPANSKKKLVIGLVLLAAIVCAVVLIVKIILKNHNSQGYDDVLNGIEKAMSTEEFTDMIEKKYNGKNGYGNFTKYLLYNEDGIVAIIEDYCGHEGIRVFFTGCFSNDKLSSLIVMITVFPECELPFSEFMEELMASYSRKYGKAAKGESASYIWEIKSGKLTILDTSNELEEEHNIAILFDF